MLEMLLTSKLLCSDILFPYRSPTPRPHPTPRNGPETDPKQSRNSATKMTGRPGHWSEPGEYNILFLGSTLVISSQDSSALGYREFTQEGAMTISPFAARGGTSAPQWPNVKQCCRHLVPSSDFFVQSYAGSRNGPKRPKRSRNGPKPSSLGFGVPQMQMGV